MTFKSPIQLQNKYYIPATAVMCEGKMILISEEKPEKGDHYLSAYCGVCRRHGSIDEPYKTKRKIISLTPPQNLKQNIRYLVEVEQLKTGDAGWDKQLQLEKHPIYTLISPLNIISQEEEIETTYSEADLKKAIIMARKGNLSYDGTIAGDPPIYQFDHGNKEILAFVNQNKQ